VDVECRPAYNGRDAWSRATEHQCESPSLSRDARFVSFVSFATNLVTDRSSDLYVRDQ
jgi:hypothetical protein